MAAPKPMIVRLAMFTRVLRLSRNSRAICSRTSFFIEANYPAKTGAENRALAGLSMGGGQSLNFGLGHLDTFASVGGFSSAPNTRIPEKLLPNPDEAKKKLKLLWISVGDKDGLFSFSERTHRYMAEHNVPHIWQVQPGGHDFNVWKQDLYHFSQLLFR